MKLDREKVYLAMAAKNFSVADLCIEMDFTQQSFYQLFKQKKNNIRTVGEIARILSIHPADIVLREKMSQTAREEE